MKVREKTYDAAQQAVAEYLKAFTVGSHAHGLIYSKRIGLARAIIDAVAPLIIEQHEGEKPK